MTRSSFLYTAIFYLQVLWGNPLPAVDETKPLLLQRPAINKTHVAFGYAGDLWLVEREGGEARRLTSGVGLEYSPLFSPDGSKLAFTAEYDGNFDVYIAPGKGGEPRRLTFHPGVDVAVGWTPDGQSVLFSSNRTSYSRFNKLFTFRIEGEGFPQELPLPMGEEGSFSAGGSHLAYVPFWNRRSSAGAYIAWKRYRGGKASPIWIADLSDSRVEKIPRDDSNDFCPMWLSGKIYFLSDRDGPTTLYSYDVSSKQVKRELENGGYDLNYASAGPDAIVFEQFGALHIFDPASGRSKKLDVRITADFPAVRPRYEKVAKKISGSSISPTGARAAFEVRGEIVTVPAEKGDIRNLTQTTAVVERDPAWSPDGKTVAYFSDESGEYMLHLRDARGTAEPRRIALGDAPNFYFTPVWSPDSQKIAYADNRQQLWFVEVTTGQSQKVDRHAYFSGSEFDPAWSPDSRWLAYTKILDNRLQAAWLLDTTTGERHQVTDGMSDVRFLAFDKSGKYLYFTASTDIGPTTNGIDMSGMQRDVTRSVYLVVLSKELPSPLAPESDEEKVKDPAKDQPGEPDRPARDKPAAGGGIAPADSDDAKSSDAKPSSDKTPSEKEKAREEKPAVTRIDLNGIGQRVLALPIPARDYEGLQVGKAGTIFLVEMPAGPITPPTPGSPGRGRSVTKFDVEKRKVDPVISGVTRFEVSASGEKALYKQDDKWLLTDIPGGSAGSAGRAAAASASGSSEASGTLKLDDLEVYVDPRAEWKQMYHEVWRLQRDFLYDPNYHGYDLAAAEKRYSIYLDGIAHRADLNYLFYEMLGNLVLGHCYIGGGDTPEVKQVKGGLLGADFTIGGGRYRFSRIYSGENWNPQLRAPLTQPGVNVQEGDYLLAVAGKELNSTDNLYRAFEATAGKSVSIKVGPQPDGTGAREVSVTPIESETGLRNLAWIEGNRRKVDRMTDGRVAYVYLPDTAFGGFTNFNRYFFAQVNKQAVVIDERFNGGGKAADYIIDYLDRPLLNYWTPRTGKIYTTPGGAIFGPKAMIINEFAGSGGDAMPWYFRRAKLGPLVGKRTWGGLVGISGYPPLLDGGSVTAPSFAFFSPDGVWDVENHGVAPDVEVEHDPFEVRQGRDPQLEKAVAVVLQVLDANPPPKPRRPEFPNYHKTEGAAR